MMQQTLPTALWLPPAVVIVAVVVALLADAANRRRGSVWVMGVGLGLAAAICFVLTPHAVSATSAGVLSSGVGFTSLPGVGYVLAACAVIAGLDRLAALDRGPAAAALVGLGALFSHALIASGDTKVLFVALVGAAIVAYALVGGAGTRRAEEAAVRYFVQGAVVSGLTVYGLAVLFGLAGGASGYEEIGSALDAGGGRSAVLAVVLILSVFAFKLGAFPFHSWVPDAYETGKASDVGFLASTPKLAALVALFVLLSDTVSGSPDLSATKGVLLMLALGSLLFGAFGMVRQRTVGRLLGYSAIAQAGYGVAALTSGSGAMSAVVVFGVTYAVGVCAAFVALEAVRHADPGWDGSLAGLAGLSHRSPVVAACLALSMLSLAGIPLFAGFWGKYAVLLALVGADMIWLAAVAALAAVLSFAGYGMVVRWAYFETDSDSRTTSGDQTSGAEAPEVGEGAVEAPSHGRTTTVVAVALAAAVVLLGCVPLVTGLEPMAAFFRLK